MNLSADLFPGKLVGSFYGTEDHIHQISDRFDETTKKTFRSASDVCLVPFGSTTDRDLTHGIRSGKLKLTGYVSLPNLNAGMTCSRLLEKRWPLYLSPP